MGLTMERNVKVIRRAAQRLRDKPLGYDQYTYGRCDERAPCGMVCCLGGELVICSEPTEELGLAKLRSIIESHHETLIWDMACQIVGIELNNQDARIFGCTVKWWPKQFRLQYLNSPNQQGQAFAAADFLDYLADGGKIS